MMLFSLYLNGIIFAIWFLSFKGIPWQNPFTQVKTGVIDFFMFINALLFASVVAYGVYCKLILLYSGQQFNAGNYQKKSIRYESMNFISLAVKHFEVKT